MRAQNKQFSDARSFAEVRELVEQKYASGIDVKFLSESQFCSFGDDDQGSDGEWDNFDYLNPSRDWVTALINDCSNDFVWTWRKGLVQMHMRIEFTDGAVIDCEVYADVSYDDNGKVVVING